MITLDAEWNVELKDFVPNMYQDYDAEKCNRNVPLSKNVVEDSDLWQESVPHAYHSGNCYTYKYRLIAFISILYFPCMFKSSPMNTSALGNCYAIR